MLILVRFLPSIFNARVHDNATYFLMYLLFAFLQKKRNQGVFGCIQLSDVSCDSKFIPFLIETGQSQLKNRYLPGCKSRLRRV